MIDFEQDTIIVTGSHGFLGSYVVETLKKRGAKHIKTMTKSDCDLTESSSVYCFFLNYTESFDYKWPSPIHVIHCAGYNGGIEFNRREPIKVIESNTLMGFNLLKQCVRFGVKKVVSVMSSCAYQDSKKILCEEEFGYGPCNPSIECHGYAKRMLFYASKAYKQQIGLNAVTACITNLYGPRDSFHPLRTKVVGALVKKFVDAKNENSPNVICWGSGKPLREFMYVKDAAEYLVRTLEVYDDTSLPINIGTGSDISIKKLAKTIAKLVGYKGKIIWDTSKGDGQMKKLLSNKRTKEILGELQLTSLEGGLLETIRYYEGLPK